MDSRWVFGSLLFVSSVPRRFLTFAASSSTRNFFEDLAHTSSHAVNDGLSYCYRSSSARRCSASSRP